MIHFSWRRFEELTATQVYQVLALRSEVFVVEQKCAFMDPDGKDMESLHLLGEDDYQVQAYLRLFLPTEIDKHLLFGRVVTAKDVRSKGYGKALIKEMLTFCSHHFPKTEIKCSAQCYLKHFYENFGFISYGPAYDEDGIPHVDMKKTQKDSPQTDF